MKIGLMRDDSLAFEMDIQGDAVPVGKAAKGWRRVREIIPRAGEGQSIGGPIVALDGDDIVKTFQIVSLGPPSAMDIKAEARRRILNAYPEWMQANMTARGVELQDIWRRNGQWTAEEQGEADALAAAWAWIKGIRAKSDALEAMSPIPTDYTADQYWT